MMVFSLVSRGQRRDCALLRATVRAALIAAGITVAAIPAGRASAAQVTLIFDDVSDLGGSATGPYQLTEQGISYSVWPESHGSAGAIHLDDAGTGYQSAVTFTGTDRFDVVSLDVEGLGQSLYVYDEIWDGTPLAYDNVLFEGLRGGEVVASLLWSTGLSRGWQNLAFDNAFSDLDSFLIRALVPDLSVLPDQTECIDYPCGHFNIDNLTLDVAPAPVPLPAGLPLLLGGYGMLILGAMRQRSNRRKTRCPHERAAPASAVVARRPVPAPGVSDHRRQHRTSGLPAKDLRGAMTAADKPRRIPRPPRRIIERHRPAGDAPGLFGDFAH